MPEGRKQFEPIKKTGMMGIFYEMRKEGILSSWEVDRLMSDNESKQERFYKYNLPIFITWGPTESLEGTVRLIPDSWNRFFDVTTDDFWTNLGNH